LIKSLAELKNDLRKKIKLIIIGMDSETSKYLSLLCEKNEIKDMTIFIPKIKYDLISSYISICDVGIIPLPPENKWWQVSSPLKTLEYMAMEKPIIVTSIPAHQRIFAKGECGVLLETNSPKALAEAITYLYKNRSKLDTMGKIGKEIVEKYYTWESKALDVENFLKSVLRE
jgi:glycosyltransferase involved in cell wall biosynthesis